MKVYFVGGPDDPAQKVIEVDGKKIGPHQLTAVKLKGAYFDTVRGPKITQVYSPPSSGDFVVVLELHAGSVIGVHWKQKKQPDGKMKYPKEYIESSNTKPITDPIKKAKGKPTCIVMVGCYVEAELAQAIADNSGVPVVTPSSSVAVGQIADGKLKPGDNPWQRFKPDGDPYKPETVYDLNEIFNP